jgi:hypothetical protein
MIPIYRRHGIQQTIAAFTVILLAYMNALNKVPGRYDLTTVLLTTFTFSAQSQSLSVDNAVL